MTLSGPLLHYACVVYEAHRENFNEDRPIGDKNLAQRVMLCSKIYADIPRGSPERGIKRQ